MGNEWINKTDVQNYLGNIRMAFKYLDEEMINILIRPKKDIKKLERLQRTATKIVSSLRNLLY